jgi:hypothetical protein
MLDLGGADAEGQGSERPMGGGMAVAADDRHARLGQAQLRPHDMDHAPVLQRGKHDPGEASDWTLWTNLAKKSPIFGRPEKFYGNVDKSMWESVTLTCRPSPFVDRLKDVIRRRGENISSFELEAEITAHPKVKEAVAVAVPSDVSEDEVLAVVTAIEGETVDPAELIGFLADRVAHYMVPRYIRVVDDLPKTASGKLQKHLLRSDGLTDDTWDRETAGLRLKRESLA